MKHAANVHIKFADGSCIDRVFWHDNDNKDELEVEAESFCQMIGNLFKDSSDPVTDYKISYKFE